MSGISSTEEALGGLYPNLEADTTYVGPLATISANNTEAEVVEGFAANGDFFNLPANSTDTLDYFDNTGTQIATGSWSGGLAHTDLNAAVDGWTGFMLDATDSLMYVVGADTGTAPDTFYWASINAAGTLGTVFTAQLTTDFAASPIWGSPNLSSSVHRTADGAGNLFVRKSASGITEEAELNISSSAIVTDTAQVATGFVTYKTASGCYIGGFSGTTAVDTTVNISDTNNATAGPDTGSGVPYGTSGLLPLQWNGRVVLVAPTGTIIGTKAATVAKFEAFTNSMATALGV